VETNAAQFWMSESANVLCRHAAWQAKSDGAQIKQEIVLIISQLFGRFIMHGLN